MNLREIRRLFRDVSGRYDLVNDDLSDNGSDLYIRAGSKSLDRKSMTFKSSAERILDLTAGDWLVQFEYARAVQEVWIATSEGRWQLEKAQSLAKLLSDYYSDTPAEISTGSPRYYSPFLSRNIPEDITAAELTAFSTYVATIDPSGYEYNAIILSCPIDVTGVIEIKGLFYSKELVNDTDANYWSTQDPLLLVREAIRKTFVTSGNRSMNKTYEEELVKDLLEIEKDFIEQEIAECDQMRG